MQVEHYSLMNAYYRRLTSEDESVRIEASRRWSKWEMATSHLFINDEKVAKPTNQSTWALQFARIEWLVTIFPKKETQKIQCLSSQC